MKVCHWIERRNVVGIWNCLPITYGFGSFIKEAYLSKKYKKYIHKIYQYITHTELYCTACSYIAKVTIIETSEIDMTSAAQL